MNLVCVLPRKGSRVDPRVPSQPILRRGENLASEPGVCPFCLGSGMCHRCRGTGSLESGPRQLRPWRECEGAGRCALCNGTGNVGGGKPEKRDKNRGSA